MAAQDVALWVLLAFFVLFVILFFVGMGRVNRSEPCGAFSQKVVPKHLTKKQKHNLVMQVDKCSKKEPGCSHLQD